MLAPMDTMRERDGLAKTPRSSNARRPRPWIRPCCSTASRTTCATTTSDHTVVADPRNPLGARRPRRRRGMIEAMRAVQVVEPTGPSGVRVVDVAEPEPGPGDVVVEVHAV